MKRIRKFYNKYKYQLITLLSFVSLCIWIGVVGWYYFVATLVLGLIIHNFAHSFYIHRVCAHNHFKLSNFWHWIGITLFTMTNLGSPPVYVAVHLNHHKFSGNDHDPHDPYRLGPLKLFLSLWDSSFAPDRKFLAIMMKNDRMKLFHKFHLHIALFSSIFTPFIIVYAHLLSKIPIGIVHLQNIGYASKTTDTDTSRNVPWLKPITWGEELHNNHHKSASRANHNFEGSLRELDLIYLFGKLIETKK